MQRKAEHGCYTAMRSVPSQVVVQGSAHDSLAFVRDLAIAYVERKLEARPSPAGKVDVADEEEHVLDHLSIHLDLLHLGEHD